MSLSRSRMKQGAKFGRTIVLLVILYSVSMDAIIDTLDICSGNWTGFTQTILRAKPGRHSLKDHDGLFSGSYFEAQAPFDLQNKFLPRSGFDLILVNRISVFLDQLQAFSSSQLLIQLLISLPPPIA
ncbi:hypothetical protein LEP1GSC047_4248 [Leptospira inadai serovar Lyme str. 10]|uniref:Uncharacterized protein n=3 Tax=Leptospira inadai TaxID=29506 RepID=V6HDE1_9LEPT|nr:hypothetical protein LEP1GSC047_4248 [Leptospira inadai serovar Lyme str. 10]PNV73307.1 hypothetical protein BES34_017595 [Leptospira inadai serovar Lyme]